MRLGNEEFRDLETGITLQIKVLIPITISSILIIYSLPVYYRMQRCHFVKKKIIIIQERFFCVRSNLPFVIVHHRWILWPLWTASKLLCNVGWHVWISKGGEFMTVQKPWCLLSKQICSPKNAQVCPSRDSRKESFKYKPGTLLWNESH